MLTCPPSLSIVPENIFPGAYPRTEQGACSDAIEIAARSKYLTHNVKTSEML